MTNDLELENTKDLPAQEPEAEVSSDISPQDDPPVEQEAEEPVLVEPTPEEASYDEADEAEVVETASEESETSEESDEAPAEEEAQEEPETAPVDSEELEAIAAEEQETLEESDEAPADEERQEEPDAATTDIEEPEAIAAEEQETSEESDEAPVEEEAQEEPDAATTDIEEAEDAAAEAEEVPVQLDAPGETEAEGAIVEVVETAPEVVVDPLEGSTIKELRAYAKGTGINLRGARKKADIIAVIRAAESVVEEEPGAVAAEAEEVSDELDSPEDTEVEEAPSDEAEPATDVSEDEAPEAEAEVEVVAEKEDDRNWYVVHCYSGYENKVRHNLEQRIETMGMKDRIFDVVVPTEEEIEVKDGKRKTVERRVFPGYILVEMIMTEESWYVVRNTPGVTGFVGMGNEPTALRPEEVSQIIKRMEAEAPRIKVTYKTGQKVRIIDGPFNDFIGTVDEIDMERAKVRVMVSFFGRETPVELDFLQVEKA
jgi:transcriptional antiterminator NusG